MPSFATLGTLVALVAAGVIAVVQARVHVSSERSLRRWFIIGATPAVLTLVAVLSDASARRILVVLVALLVIVTYWLTYVGIARLAARPSAVSTGGALGLTTILGEMYLLGGLLQNRLRFQPDPAGSLYDGYSVQSIGELLLALGPVPALLLGALLWPVRWTSRISAAASDAGAKLAHLSYVGVAWGRLSRRFATKTGLLLVIAGVALVVGSALPLLGSGRSRLTLFGIMVSEWLRPFAYLFVAASLIHNRHALVADVSLGTAPRKIARLLIAVLIVPLALIGLGFVRNDYGSSLPLLFAIPAALLSFGARDQSAYLTKSGFDPDSSPGSVRGGTRLVLMAIAAFGALMIVVASLVSFWIMPIGKGRVETWQNPWQYSWTVECRETSTPASWIKLIPQGYSLCVQDYAERLESDKSQMAKVLTALDGGGLWGRGYSDSEAGLVPVRDSDFVLASVWSKLGALVVLALTGLTVVVWYILARRTSRQGWVGRRSADADTFVLYGSALGAAIAGQAVYVLAATANVLPHSGVPFPFIARGGQAMGGLALGVLLLIGGLARLPAPSDSLVVVARHSKYRGFVPFLERNFGIELMSAVAIGSILVGVLNPFGARLTGNNHDGRVLPASGLQHPGVQAMLRARGAAPTVVGSQGLRLVGERASGIWRSAPGTTAPLPVHDLFGVLRTSRGGAPGLLEGTTGVTSASQTTRTVADRLGFPARTEGASLEVTIDPALQHATATAARAPLTGAIRLPAGAVVLDANTGAVLALTSSPDQPDYGAVTASQDEVAAWLKTNGQPGELLSDGTIAKPDKKRSCSGPGIKCAAYSLNPVGRGTSDNDYLRTYVGGSAAELPRADVNRAAGRAYELGSTFKIVVAAAYLESGPNKKITDKIESPARVSVGGQQKGRTCSGTVNGQIALTDALRVSCNNAFIALARSLGWEKVADVGRRLGFTLVSPGKPTPTALWPAASTLPARAGFDEIGVAAIGGGGVTGTPYGMAALMAAIVNGGTYHQPSLVRGGLTAQPTPETGVTALSGRTAASLTQGLATVTGEDGTLADVDTPESVTFIGKSGTHVRQGMSASDYTTHYFWVVGAASRQDGTKQPISFAVVVEGHDAEDGHDQVRAIAKAILDVYAG